MVRKMFKTLLVVFCLFLFTFIPVKAKTVQERILQQAPPENEQDPSVDTIYEVFLPFIHNHSLRPDLKVSPLTLSPNPAEQGATVSLTGLVENAGFVDAGAFVVEWKVFPLGETEPLITGYWDVAGLLIGESINLETSFEAAQPGPFTVQVIADPLMQVPDTFRLNNSAELELGVTGIIHVSDPVVEDDIWAYATYVIDNDISVAAGTNLIVRSCAVIKPDSETDIQVDGTIDMIGTEECPVVVTSINDDSFGSLAGKNWTQADPAPGDWNNIQILPGGTVNIVHALFRFGINPIENNGGTLNLRDSIVEFASGNAIYCYNNGLINVINNTFQHNGMHGILFSGQGSMASVISNNTFSNNTNYAVYFSPTGDITFDGSGLSGNTAINNGTNGIRLSGTLAGNSILSNAGIPYVLEEDDDHIGSVYIPAGSTLEIQEGAIFKSPRVSPTLGRGTGFEVAGNLQAYGTEAAPIIFTSIHDDTYGGDTNNNADATNPASGDWKGQIIRSGGSATFDRVLLRYAGGSINGQTEECIRNEGGSLHFLHSTIELGMGVSVRSLNSLVLDIQDSVIKDSTDHGVLVQASGSTAPIILNTTFQNNVGYAIYFDLAGEMVLDASQVGWNVAINNGTDGVYLQTTLDGNSFLNNAGFPYVLNTGLTVKNTGVLTLISGTVLKLGNAQSLLVNGSLVVIGTELEPVVITSIKDDSIGGDTNNDGDATTPAKGDWNSIIIPSGGSVEGSYASIRYGGWYWCGVNCYGEQTPLHVQNGGSLDLDHVTLSQSANYGVRVDPSSTSQLTVTNSNIEYSDQNGIRAEGIASSNLVITNNTFTGNASSAVYLNFNNGAVGEISNNNGTGNLINGIQLSGTIGVDTTLSPNPDFPYVIQGGLAVAAGHSLSISPDVVVKFASHESITAYGELMAAGGDGSRITFTSMSDDSVGGDTNNNGDATAPAKGDWNSIIIPSGGSVDLSYANIRFGGWYYCGVSCYGDQSPLHVLDGGNLTSDHVALSQNAFYGIRVEPSSTTQLSVTNSSIETSDQDGIIATGIAGNAINITNNTFTVNGASAVHLQFNGGTIGSLEGNTGSGNTINGIRIYGSPGDTTLALNVSLPYVIQGGLSVTAGHSLSLAPSVVVKFAVNEAITVSGNLQAAGSGGSEITFTSIKDDSVGGDTNNDGNITAPAKGDWNSIIIASGGSVDISFANLRFGGWYYCGVNCYGEQSPLHVLDGGSLSLNLVTISQNANHGIRVDPSSTTTFSVTQSTMEYSDQNGIRAEGIASSNMFIGNNTFVGNGAVAVYLNFNNGAPFNTPNNSGTGNFINGIQLSGTIGNNATLSSNPGFPYVIKGGLTIAPGTTLTLSPDVIIKFDYAETLTVNGSLSALGTDTSSIEFTSIKDDSVGGDTNNDGSSTVPNKGDWNSIEVGSSASITFNYANIRYGGWYWCGVNCYGNNITLYLRSSAPSIISHTVLRDSAGHGIYASENVGSTSLTIEDSMIGYNNLTGIHVGVTGTYHLTMMRTTIRNNTTGLELQGTQAAASIIDSDFLENNDGIHFSGNYAPVVSNCIFEGNTSYGLYNSTGLTVTATDNWWEDASGPFNPTHNPTGLGDQVSNGVTFSPWLTTRPR